jgi:hypothetical protein
MPGDLNRLMPRGTFEKHVFYEMANPLLFPGFKA